MFECFVSQSIVTSTSKAVIIISGRDFDFADLKSQIYCADGILSAQNIPVTASCAFLRALLKVSPAEGEPKDPQIPGPSGRCVALL